MESSKQPSINYIHELNAFYKWIEINPVPSSAICLWQALMNQNNRLRWRKSFTVSIRYLSEKTGLERKSIFRAREILTNSGRIKWINRGLNAACYELIPFSATEFEDIYEPTYSKEEVDNSDPEVDDINFEFTKKQLDLFQTDEALAADQTEVTPPEKTMSETMGMGLAMGLAIGLPMGPIRNNNNNYNNNNKELRSFNGKKNKKINATQIFEYYNLTCINLVHATTFSNARKENIRKRLREHGPEKVIMMLQQASQSEHLAGKNNIGWKANIDWLFKPSNFVKVLDGNYNNQNMNSSLTQTVSDKASPIEILNVCYAKITGNEKVS